MNTGPLRVVVADDSATIRALLRQWLSPELGFEIVGEAANGKECVQLVLSLSPAIVVMDMDMPVMDGVEATQEIMSRQPTPILIFTSSEIDSRRGVFFKALAAGALDIFHKPRLTTDEEINAATDSFRRLLKLLAPIKPIRRGAMPPKPAAWVPSPRSVPGFPKVLAIAASTGGPAALINVLKDLRPGFPVCTLLVQHMAAEFMPGFADWLGQNIGLPVRLAVHGDAIRSGVVLVAPGDMHMRLTAEGSISLDRSDPKNSCRPSADLLFDSVARVTGPGSIGVILTGMGEDGANGLLHMRQSGALTIAQNEATCVVYGMPKAAAETGAAVQVLPLEDIGNFIMTRFKPEVQI